MTSLDPRWQEKTLAELSPLMRAVAGAVSKWKPREERSTVDDSPNYHDRFGVRFDPYSEP